MKPPRPREPTTRRSASFASATSTSAAWPSRTIRVTSTPCVSACSIAALHAALAEAHVRGAGLKVVSAWHVPPAAYQSGWVTLPIQKEDYEQIGKSALDKSLEAVAAERDGVPVTPIVREGQAAEVLVAEARGADLLVVGSRGLGGFKGLLLGSVSQQCAHHAGCPVLIVPAVNGARP